MIKIVENQTRWIIPAVVFGLAVVASAIFGFKSLAVEKHQPITDQQSTRKIDTSETVSPTNSVHQAISSKRPSIDVLDSSPRLTSSVVSGPSDKVADLEATKALQLSVPAELAAIDEITHFRDVQQTLAIFTELPAESIQIYLDDFNTNTDRDGYAPAVFRAGYERLAEIDFDATLDEILINIDHSPSGNSYWDNLALSVLADQQPEYVARSIALVSGVFQNPAAKHALDKLALSLDPETAALEALQQIQLSGGGSRHNDLLDSALNSWILKDPQSALEFVQTEINDEIQRHVITTDLLAQWLEHDPTAATPAVESVLNAELNANPDAYVDLVDVYVSQKATTDPEGALQWLQALDSEYIQNTVIDSVLHPWVDQDRSAAMNYLSRLDEQSASQLLPLAIPIVANSLQGDSASVQEAIDWSSRLPEALQNTTRQQLVGAWIRSHPQESVDWLIQQSYGGQSQDLVLPAAQALAREDAEAAARLHASLSGDIQLALTGNIIMSLARHGEDRTIAWLNSQTDELVISRGRRLVNDLF